MLDLLAVQGTTLTTLVLPDTQPFEYGMLLDCIGPNCPNLTRIIVGIYWRKDYSNDTADAPHFTHHIPATLTHLGIILSNDIANDLRGMMRLTPEHMVYSDWLASAGFEKCPAPLGLELIRFFNPERFLLTPPRDRTPGFVRPTHGSVSPFNIWRNMAFA